MNRVSVMEKLAGSLIHEITQTHRRARNNARAAMHFLDRNSPIWVKSGKRSPVSWRYRSSRKKIIDGVRDHSRKRSGKDRLDLNDAIKEVIGCTNCNSSRTASRSHAPHGGALIVKGDSLSTAASRV